MNIELNHPTLAIVLTSVPQTKLRKSAIAFLMRQWNRPFFAVFAVCASIGMVVGEAQAQQNRAVPLPQAHAHNDYRHERPLFDAINRGFCSVEADVFLIDGELLVGHDLGELRPDRTLRSLYLEPLAKLARNNQGRVYPNGPTITLLVDFKNDGEATYGELRDQLKEYSDILSGLDNGEYKDRAIQIVISGNRPIDMIAADKDRLVSIDGRLGDLNSSSPSHLMPLISDRWTSHFRWRGEDEFPDQEIQKLKSIVDQAHAAGRRVRFWATPESPALWQALVDAGVDHINTDQLDQLRDFLLGQQEAKR